MYSGSFLNVDNLLSSVGLCEAARENDPTGRDILFIINVFSDHDENSLDGLIFHLGACFEYRMCLGVF